ASCGPARRWKRLRSAPSPRSPPETRPPPPPSRVSSSSTSVGAFALGWKTCARRQGSGPENGRNGAFPPSPIAHVHVHGCDLSVIEGPLRRCCRDGPLAV